MNYRLLLIALLLIYVVAAKEQGGVDYVLASNAKTNSTLLQGYEATNNDTLKSTGI